MKFSGVLRWRDSDGNTGEIARFNDVEALDADVARAAVVDEGWDHRLDSACCIPVVEFFEPDDDGLDDEAATG